MLNFNFKKSLKISLLPTALRNLHSRSQIWPSLPLFIKITKPPLYPQHPLIQVEAQDLDFRSLLNQSDLKLDYQQVTIALSTQYPKSSTSTLQMAHPLLTTTNTPSQTYKSGSTSPNFEHFLDFAHFVKTPT